MASATWTRWCLSLRERPLSLPSATGGVASVLGGRRRPSRQNPQKTLSWPLPVVFTAAPLFVAVGRAKAIGRPWMSKAAGGGQSWGVGKLGFSAESAGVHAPPLLGPPWHTLLKHTGQG